MARTYYVDGVEITLTPHRAGLDVDVDRGGASATIPGGVLGRFSIPWKRREVEVRRFGAANAIETELWADAAYVPAGPAPRRAKEAARCGPHGARSKGRCAACDAVACRRCLALDGARCAECFERAAVKERRGRTRAWLLGAGFCAFVAVAAFAGAMATGAEWLPRIAGAMVFGAAFMTWFALRRPRSDAGPLVPLALTRGEPPSPVGRSCAACRERVGTARDGAWCERCRKPLHARCEAGHACKRPARGPDWRALEA